MGRARGGSTFHVFAFKIGKFLRSRRGDKALILWRDAKIHGARPSVHNSDSAPEIPAKEASGEEFGVCFFAGMMKYLGTG